MYREDNEGNGDWYENRRMVLKTLDRLEGNINVLNDKLVGIQTDVTIIKTKAALIAAGIAMAVAVATSIIAAFITKT